MMKTISRYFVLSLFYFQGTLAGILAEPLGQLSSSSGQLGQALSWVDVPDSKDLVYAVQFSRDGRLLLTANESFFPKLGLRAEGTGTVADVANLNGGKSFATLGKWDAGDAAEWGTWLTKPGKIKLHLRFRAGGSKSRFKIELVSGDHSSSVPQSSSFSVSKKMAAVDFDVKQAGRYSIVLTCEKGGRGVVFDWIEIDGAAAEGGGVLRKRWRPAAAHTRFSSSRATGRVRLWVMEMDAVAGDLGFYSPITTPFGYYGPTWNANGTVNAGINFSIWSFQRGQSEPPVEQLSHLLAIGNRQAEFSGFDHEGTGVKIRGWEPLAGRQGQKQTLALRVEPGEKYDTYYSYFYATDEKRWRLFGVGNKYNKGKPLKSLTVGSFVEVPGPPPVQRTGAWERRMRYRGWVMDDKGKWSALDQMGGGDVDKATGLTYTDRGIGEDGWFYLQTGGWYFRKVKNGGAVKVVAPSASPKPSYLDAKGIAFLTTLPAEINLPKIERNGDQVRVSLEIRNIGKNPKVTLYWGEKEGLTFADRWQHQKQVAAKIREGKNQVILKKVPAGKVVFVRALLQNDDGQFWTVETASAK
ncbi:MAG: DUF3472 domain-containing protein [Verrucomicrobiales bacterium]|nr:DUF3472 domain-containing protein [Verrucomicrobiales bacterium]